MGMVSIVLAGCASVANAAHTAKIEKLRCEYLTNPLGIGVTKPRLSWILASSRRGEKQTASQILVSSSPELLAKGTGDLWDSGKVNGDKSTHIEYAGKALTSRMRCYWKTRVWDRDGKPGQWSKPAMWTMGLLAPGDWKARWIDASPLPLSLSTTVFTIRKATYEAVDGAGQKDVTALLSGMAKNGVVRVTVNNVALGDDPAFQHVKQLRVAYDLSGKSQEIVVPENQVLTIPNVPTPIPYLRKTFTVQKKIRHASLYATALGIYELSLNGRRVGDHVLAPDWTDYRKRVRYQEYDVTSLLKSGPNALGGMVGNGWYSGHIGNGGYQFYGKASALLAQLEINYEDGTTDLILTDDSWKARNSPILSSDFMLGENYDARTEVRDWNSPQIKDGNEAEWKAVAIRNEPLPSALPFDAQVTEPVRITGHIKPKSLKEAKPGHWVFDLGQNMVGVVSLKIAAPAGTKITIRHAEMLNPDGSIYTTNLRSALSVDTYTTKSESVETWKPRFTFHGFRYVELTGLPSRPSMDAVRGIVLNSDTPRSGEFACSDPRINQLQSNIQWGQRGNYLSVPTDCPQRDERMGWMGDAQVFVRTATYNADVAAFFTKWLVDVDDAQTPDGAYSDISPSYGGGGTPAWGDAGVICPWTIYVATGDRRILETHLSAMTKWVEWCRVHSSNLIRDRDRNGDYGDWLSIGADTPKDLIGTAYFAYSAHLLAASYRAVGDMESAAKYESLFEDIKTAFNQKYVSPDGRIKGNTQCAYAMALKFELLPPSLRSVAAQYLEDDIRGKGEHLSTGFVGVSYLLPTLTQAGKLDTAYKLLLQDTFPSWLFSVKQGATTIWERWDGWTPEKGFQDPGMNSFNHYSLGSCGEWLFDTVAGIAPDPAFPGYRHILISPHPGGTLTWAKAHYDSIYGRISTEWKRTNGVFTLKVTLPANTSGTVSIPTRQVQSITESGKPILQATGIKFVREEGGYAVYEVEAGHYLFTSAL